MRLYVGNLPFKLNQEELEALFAEHGSVDDVCIIKRRGRSLGYGFVEMPDDSEARDAINALNDYEVMERAISVNEANEREEKPQKKQERKPKASKPSNSNKQKNQNKPPRKRAPRRRNNKSSGNSSAIKYTISVVLNIVLILLVFYFSFKADSYREGMFHKGMTMATENAQNGVKIANKELDTYFIGIEQSFESLPEMEKEIPVGEIDYGIMRVMSDNVSKYYKARGKEPGPDLRGLLNKYKK